MALASAEVTCKTWGTRQGPGPDLIEHRVSESQGPNLRLSWPHAGDRRRAVVGKSPLPRAASREPHAGTRIIQVSQRDMEMHYYLSHQAPKGNTPETISGPLLTPAIQAGEQDLIQYFQLAASRSLATFGRDPADLGDVVIRVALARNTASSTALFHALLALSLLHRHGDNPQAVERKIAALEALTAASGRPIDATEAMQHVATNMLLCSLEIHKVSCSSGEWTCYLRSAKDIIQAAGLDELPHDSDLVALLDWVYYHDVLARFSLRHWHRESSKLSPSSTVASSPSGVSPTTQSPRAEPSKSASPPLALIQLLSEVCDAASGHPPSMTTAEQAEHKSFLKILDWRIRSLELPAPADGDADASLVMELYRLAMLVYLSRASENLRNPSARTQQHIDKAFAMLARLGSCDRQFPVFVLGCEARSDDQRAVVLDLIARTEKGSASRSFNLVRLLLQASWAQDELGKGGMDYWDKLNCIVSCCKILPAFV
ncbi:fungal-specific transcription factor domain-containing protein [Parachaetomium inaequale]|uniref:Fungal-specific transcription factor domain-containing protein n=1 Tax=Parachaetomium inaequale TaxID=2588326 RepID=A0AAN6SQF9_9PEZI|nr:fungal-specific transcription factor domain-containing protein [Parachaetomium inaequale]